MPRGRYSSSSRSHSNPNSATILSADRILQKESQYRNNISKLHASTLMLAEVIAISGAVESSLRNDDDPDDPENREMDAFMQEQRSKLKSLTERHVSSSRYIDAFMKATNSIKGDIVQSVVNAAPQDGQGTSSSSSSQESPPDYETILQTKLEFEKHNIEKNAIC